MRHVAVTHEHLTPLVHHVEQQLISRDVHQHHIRRRVLPIIDIQTLPARHYVPGPDGHLFEVPSEQIQDRLRDHHSNWVIAETVSRTPQDKDYPGYLKRLLSLHRAPPKQIGYRRYLTPDGHERQETTWRHEPKLESPSPAISRVTEEEIGGRTLRSMHKRDAGGALDSGGGRGEAEQSPSASTSCED